MCDGELVEFQWSSFRMPAGTLASSMLSPTTEATLLVSTTRRTDGLRLTDSSTLAVPSTAGRTSASFASVNPSSTNGEAVCITISQPAAAASKLP